jgi:HSP20 family protein
LSEEKKKMNYYYSGKEKSAKEIKKTQGEQGSSLSQDLETDFNKMMSGFQRDFENFWDTSKRVGGEMKARTRTAISPAMPSVDLEDKGKLFELTVDLPGFKKENVQIELTDDSVTVSAKRSAREDEEGKNFVRRERSSQMFYRKISLPEEIFSDEASAKLEDGVLEVSLPKRVPKESKKLTVM